MTITFEFGGRKRIIKYDGRMYMPITVIAGKSKKGEPIETDRVDGYFNQLGGAVKQIVRTYMGEDDSEVTLLEYVRRWENAVKEIHGIIEDEF